jgi:transposase
MNFFHRSPKTAGREACGRSPRTRRWMREKYSPDLNQIELAFSKLKAHLRKAAEHTLLRRRIVTDFSPQEGRNFFRHIGYART